MLLGSAGVKAASIQVDEIEPRCVFRSEHLFPIFFEVENPELDLVQLKSATDIYLSLFDSKRKLKKLYGKSEQTSAFSLI